MGDQSKPIHTGERIIERLDTLAQKQDQLAATQASLKQTLDRIDRQLQTFLDPAMDIQGWLKQMRESYQRQVDALNTLQRAVQQEHSTTRKAVAIHMSDPASGGQARERNGSD